MERIIWLKRAQLFVFHLHLRHALSPSDIINSAGPPVYAPLHSSPTASNRIKCVKIDMQIDAYKSMKADECL
ncbi:hypothetical protein TGRH88_072040 [Toxoplasma gondii]|uniref:Uncharacterized protein n=1 Tax=Toxoplasma gondii TaxID=5811 RepID=A0A7J6K377_TOXGO|nr:hypothetical protein TGRH88_072040 [Toxoplasma gondii]